MGIHVAAPTTGISQLICERSPRVALLTDADAMDCLPLEIREATDSAVPGDLSSVGRNSIPEEQDGALIWCQGEKPISGTAADWRRAFFSQPVCSAWVVVHWPCVENADFLGLEPRVWLAGARSTFCNPGLRIAGAVPSEKMTEAWAANGAPWARHSLALWREMETPGAGVDALRELWQQKDMEPIHSALVLRNLIVSLMRRKDWAKAEELLELGKKAFPDYREFSYLHGVSYLLQKRISKAIKFLEGAVGPGNREFAGSGGENTYRARYLLGTVCDTVGQQEKAVNYWMPCVNERPVFEPAVRALLSQQIPRARAAWLHQPLGEMVRREPRFLAPVLNFMIAHTMLAPARRLADTMVIPDSEREIYLDAIRHAEGKLSARPRNFSAKAGVVLSGPLLDASGHARINRAIGLALLGSPEFDASFDPTTWPTLALETVPQGEKLWRGVQRQSANLDLTIRHQWPPKFDRPASGKLVCILPWEHRAVPMKWVAEIESNVDELWVPSNFVRDAFRAGGVSPARVKTVPNGVDINCFSPQGPATKIPGCRGFVFLFVGGPIRRKGIDLLLQAYGDAFSPSDDVTLVVKDLGSKSFYSAITRIGDVQSFGSRFAAPHTLVVKDEMDDASLAALYRRANALVLPYRGEGFGMPMVEAMACGTPVIATGAGPAVEFCAAENSYLLPAQEVRVPEPPPPLGEFTGEWTWFEPDVAALARTMRHVYENRGEARERGKKAAHAIRQTLAWDRVVPKYLQRIKELTAEKPSEGGMGMKSPSEIEEVLLQKGF